MKYPILFLCTCVLLFGRLDEPSSISHLAVLPESNPYRSVLEKVEEFSIGDLNVKMEDDGSGVTDETRRQVQEIMAEFRAIPLSQTTNSGDWPMQYDPEDPENPARSSVPYVSEVRALARMALQQTEELSADESLSVYEAVAKLSQEERKGGTLIHHLVSIAEDGQARRKMVARLNDYSAEALGAFAARWQASHADADEDVWTVLNGERNTFLVPLMLHQILPLLEGDLEPSEREADWEPETAAFFDNLRLSGLMDLGGGDRRISLENMATGKVFSLREGHGGEDVELVSMDFDHQQAVIRHGDAEAVVLLESRTIVRKRSNWKKLLGLLDVDADNKESVDQLKAFVLRAKEYEGGPAAYVAMQIERLDDAIAHVIASASQARNLEDKDEGPPEVDDYLLAQVIPTYRRVARTVMKARVENQMLQAAIQMRLKEMGRETGEQIKDPWSEEGSGFSVEKTDSGRVIMRSRYEMKAGEPVTFEFGG